MMARECFLIQRPAVLPMGGIPKPHAAQAYTGYIQAAFSQSGILHYNGSFLGISLAYVPEARIL